jgi:uncharacterized protein (TIGR03437 family)
MIFQRQLLAIAGISLVCVAAQAHEYGPDPRYTGAPGDNKTSCISSGCHQGTANSNTSGNVRIVLPGGSTTYVPGQAITVQVQITDPQMKSYGFELTARLASNSTNGQAGDFAAGSDHLTQVLCDGGSLHDDGNGNRVACGSFPVQFVEHNTAGWQASISTKGSFTYSFTWTAPAAGAGNVVMYVAANSGTGQRLVSPTDVFTSNVTLTPGSSAPTPTISNVLNAAGFANGNFVGTMAANTYATVYGTSLSTSTFDTWSNSFTQGPNGPQMPTALDGTTITVGGTPAYITFVSPGQVNFITPNTTATGNGVPVVISVNGTLSANFNVTLQGGGLAPAFFTWQPSTPADYGKYLIAQHQATGTNVGKVGLFPGTPPDFTTPAKPGEILVLYGTGFGPTTPPIPPGIETDPTGSVLYKINATVTLGGINCPVVFAGLGPGLSQVYQFDITVPSSLPAGDHPLIATVNGAQSVSGLITVQP